MWIRLIFQHCKSLNHVSAMWHWLFLLGGRLTRPSKSSRRSICICQQILSGETPSFSVVWNLSSLKRSAGVVCIPICGIHRWNTGNPVLVFQVRDVHLCKSLSRYRQKKIPIKCCGDLHGLTLEAPRESADVKQLNVVNAKKNVGSYYLFVHFTQSQPSIFHSLLPPVLLMASLSLPEMT